MCDQSTIAPNQTPLLLSDAGPRVNVANLLESHGQRRSQVSIPDGYTKDREHKTFLLSFDRLAVRGGRWPPPLPS